MQSSRAPRAHALTHHKRSKLPLALVVATPPRVTPRWEPAARAVLAYMRANGW